jgi:CO/xanthine dehydrogenase FAD-binding subunit
MKAFTYERADSVTAAARAVADKPGAKFIAGGTNLLELMKLEVETPKHLVDVNRCRSPRSRMHRTAACGSERSSATAISRRTRVCARTIRC